MTSLAQLVIGATFSISGPYALQDSDFCPGAVGSSSGTVESVRVVPLVRDLHGFDPEVLEHKVAPETAEELVVRLDAGPVVIFTERQSRHLQAGQRVTVTLSGSDAAVQSDPCSVPVAIRQ